MKSYARATVLGRVGNDVVLRHTKNGKAVTNLSIATSERRREGPESTTWHRVVLWDHLAEIAHRYVRKGQPVFVDGHVTSSDWTDPAGQRHVRVEIVARDMVLIGSSDQAGPPRVREAMGRGGEDAGDALPEGQAPDGEELEPIEDELPF